jgi:hypothetical protein
MARVPPSRDSARCHPNSANARGLAALMYWVCDHPAVLDLAKLYTAPALDKELFA